MILPVILFSALLVQQTKVAPASLNLAKTLSLLATPPRSTLSTKQSGSSGVAGEVDLPIAQSGWILKTQAGGSVLQPSNLKPNELFVQVIASVEKAGGTERQNLDALWSAVGEGRTRGEIVTDGVLFPGWRGSIEQAKLTQGTTTVFCEVMLLTAPGKKFSSTIFATNREVYLKYKGPAYATLKTMLKRSDPAVAAEAAENVRFDKIVELASLISRRVDTEKNLTEALRVCGFTIWDQDRKTVISPMLPKLGLGISQGEIRRFASMYNKGNSFDSNNFFEAYQNSVSKIGLKVKIKEEVEGWLLAGPLDGRIAPGTTCIFVNALGASHGSTRSKYLDPVQFLVLSTLLSSDLGEPLRQAILKKQSNELFASTNFQEKLFLADGAREDLTVGIIGTLQEKMTFETGKFDLPKDGLIPNVDKQPGSPNYVGVANVLLSISKFYSFYDGLKGEVTCVESVPLVRNKDTTRGETKKLKARFWVDSAAMRDLLKENRVWIKAMCGLDVDSVHSGPLSDVETEWKMIDRSALQGNEQLFFIGDDNGARKVVTDNSGSSYVQVIGRARQKSIDPNKAHPVDLTVPIFVTPQSKRDDAGQDLVDGLFNGFSAPSNPGTAGLNLVMEFMYRCKWNGTQVYELPVRDWTEADMIGSLTATLEASDSKTGSGGALRGGYEFLQLKHSINITDCPMTFEKRQSKDYNDYLRAKLTEPRTARDRELLAKPPQHSEMYEISAQGNVVPEIVIADKIDTRTPDGGCIRPPGMFYLDVAHTGNGPLNLNTPTAPNRGKFEVLVNFEKKTATVTFEGSVPGNQRTVNGVTAGNSNPSHEERDQPMLQRFTDRIALDQNSLTAANVPIKITPGEGISGDATIPFKYGLKMNKTSTIKVHFEIAYVGKSK